MCTINFHGCHKREIYFTFIYYSFIYRIKLFRNYMEHILFYEYMWGGAGPSGHAV